MSYGGGTAKVGVCKEMESHIDLIPEDPATQFSSPIGKAVVRGAHLGPSTVDNFPSSVASYSMCRSETLGTSRYVFPSYTPSWDESLNLDDTLTFITLSVNGGSVCLIKTSTITKALAPVSMTSIRASMILIFWVVDLSRHLGARSSRRGDLYLLLGSSPSVSGVWLEDRDSERIGLLACLECKLGDRRRRLLVESAFYRWRRKSCVRRLQRNPRVAKYGKRSHKCRRKIRRMPYGGGFAKVGVYGEMESHIDFIHEGPDDTILLAHRRGGGVRWSDYSRRLGKLNMNHERCWRHDFFRRGAHLGPIIRFDQVCLDISKHVKVQDLQIASDLQDFTSIFFWIQRSCSVPDLPRQYGHADREQKSIQMLLHLMGLVFAMVGCSYAAVLLYRRFCQVTGYGGTVQRCEVRVLKKRLLDMLKREQSPPGSLFRREVVVQFNADMVPWKFLPTQREVRVKPRESALASYTAENRSSTPITGVSIHNVIPMKDVGNFGQSRGYGQAK
ncbi:cytochrome c oxidase assembly protein CtaG / Cox11 family [Actinidia rufa]|uniref:Cytochrome c oxidase assembly protein CtaG / Cox11 family n=1 Tax=Actinidia rufa TaxID=165716 RepID=A0A7J0F614_9ERIC|nr:cytochrome c oxidase assembly protein CtaG / Cox11 family [Actinidia rufa]